MFKQRERLKKAISVALRSDTQRRTSEKKFQVEANDWNLGTPCEFPAFEQPNDGSQLSSRSKVVLGDVARVPVGRSSKPTPRTIGNQKYRISISACRSFVDPRDDIHGIASTSELRHNSRSVNVNPRLREPLFQCRPQPTKRRCGRNTPPSPRRLRPWNADQEINVAVAPNRRPPRVASDPLRARYRSELPSDRLVDASGVPKASIRFGRARFEPREKRAETLRDDLPSHARGYPVRGGSKATGHRRPGGQEGLAWGPWKRSHGHNLDIPASTNA
jgi:hypothetical protein